MARGLKPTRAPGSDALLPVAAEREVGDTAVLGWQQHDEPVTVDY